MAKKSEQFAEKGYFQVPEGLLEKVMIGIQKERKLAAMRRRFILVMAGFLGIATIFVPIWNVFVADVGRSGIGQYFMLAVYDIKTVVANWQDFSLGMLESLPVISTIELCGVVLALLFALKLAVKYGQAFSTGNNFGAAHK